MIDRRAHAMTEDQLQEEVRALCRYYELPVQHIYDSRRCWLPGWPDTFMLGSSAIARELKSERGPVSREQRHVGSLLTAAGINFGIWRPRDLYDGNDIYDSSIGRTLRAIAITREAA